VIVGAFALAYHGLPRFTRDIDVLVRPSAENAARVVAALRDFGFTSGITAGDLALEDRVLQLGHPPLRIDVLTSISGISFEEVWGGRVAAELDGVPVFFIGREQFVRNKRAAGRAKDLADIEPLEGC
jgi:hypothetical protein